MDIHRELVSKGKNNTEIANDPDVQTFLKNTAYLVEREEKTKGNGSQTMKLDQRMEKEVQQIGKKMAYKNVTTDEHKNQPFAVRIKTDNGKDTGHSR